MSTTNHLIPQLIQSARATQKAIEELESQLSALSTPTLRDTAQLPQIYAHVQSVMSGEGLREHRLCFVFMATYLYSPASIYGDYPMKKGLRRAIGTIIHRCNSEVSLMLSEAKFRYERLNSYQEKIERILANYLHMSN